MVSKLFPNLLKPYKVYCARSQILSRIKSDSASSRTPGSGTQKKGTPDFEEFLQLRDYIGARTLLEVTQ